jgi:hypothetical protein
VIPAKPDVVISWPNYLSRDTPRDPPVGLKVDVDLPAVMEAKGGELVNDSP